MQHKHRFSATTMAPLLATLLGCAAQSPPPSPAALRAQWLHVDWQTATVELRAAGATVLKLGGKQAIGFRQGTAKIQNSFGSFLFNEDAQPPWTWLDRLQPAGGAELPDAVTLDGLDATGAKLARVELFATQDRYRLRVTPVAAWNRATIAYPCQPDEHFLGLGGQSFDVDHRGHRAALWVEEDGIGKLPQEDPPPLWFLNGKRHQTHTPMPLYQSSRGYAALLRSDRRVVADLCQSAPDQVRWENWDGAIDLTILRDPDPLQLRRALGRELGLPAPLPGFALMPWLDAIYGADNVRRIAKKLRDGGVPVSVLWSEDWRGGAKSGDDYTLDEDWLADDALYPNLPGLCKELHGMGYKFLTYNNTFLTSGADVYAEALAKGLTIHKEDGSPYLFTGSKFVPASMVDLTNPAARTWTAAQFATGLQAGVDGWMADFAEWLPTDARLFDGSTGLDSHQRYPVDYQRLHRDMFDAYRQKDGVERLFFVRSAWLGSQPLVNVVWGGDQQTDFSAGDGLPSVVPIGLGLGMSGFPYYGSDIAGYASAGTEPTGRELFFRWVTLGALTPIMRTHHGKLAQANWQWEHDTETEAHFAKWVAVHAQLWPYLWQVAADAELPMMRPLALHFPDFAAGWTATDQYLLGDRIVVAPVVEQGKTARLVQLPAGRWWPLFGGAEVAGGPALPVEASLTQIAAFVPEGALLPLLPADALRPFAERLTAMPAAQAAAAEPIGLHVRVWPGKARGNVGNYSGLFGQLQWQASGWSGACSSATWNGKAVALTDGHIDVQGDGTLVIDGHGTLKVGPKGNPHTAKRLRVTCLGTGWQP